MSQSLKFAATTGIAAALIFAATGAAQWAAPSAPEPIYWRQSLLTVPYQWSTPAGSTESKAVWLYVSKDRGLGWTLVADGDSRLLSFNYRAEADGEYWFAVRTTENRQIKMPATLPATSGLQPELKVIVDTAAPRVESLTAQTVSANTLEVRWRIADANLGTQSCTIEAEVGASGQWQAVPLRDITQTGPGIWEGTASLVLSEGSAATAVRATVVDLADNRARSQTAIGSDGGVPPKFAMESPVEAGWTSSSAAGVVTNQFAVPAKPQHWPADRSGHSLAAELTGGAATVAYGTPMGAGAVGGGPAANASELNLSEPTADVRPIAVESVNAMNSHRPDVLRTASLRRSEQNLGIVDSGKEFQIVPPPMNPLARRVNTRSFALEYELAEVGKDGVARVEAWGTHDGGKSWQRYAVDDDNRSPLHVTVDGDGEYGFTIVVSGAAAESAVHPQPGDTPGLWVEVDLEAPMARILEVNAARGPVGGELTVTWEAEDDHLEPRPIALYYSSRPAGPWTPIATSIENRGEFTWPIERHVPRRVYLKLEARDAAGNVAAFQTADPVVTESEPAVAKWQRLPPVQ